VPDEAERGGEKKEGSIAAFSNSIIVPMRRIEAFSYPLGKARDTASLTPLVSLG